MLSKVKLLSSKIRFSGKWLKIREDKIIKPNGTEAIHQIAERKNCILVLAFRNNELLLTKQYRYPANDFLWELPTGFINDNETPVKAAIREFEEESGLIPLKVDLLGSFWTWPGFSTQKTFVFFTDTFVNGKKYLDDSESDLKSRFIPYEKVKKYIEKGVIKTSTTLAALAMFNYKKKKKSIF